MTIQVWVWAVLVRLLKPMVPLPLLVRILCTGVWIRPHRGRVGRLRRLALASPGRIRLPGNCLNRNLALFRLLVSAGASPSLVVGMRSDARNGIGGHVWIRLEGESLDDMGDDQQAFAEFVVFDSHGCPEGSVAGRRGQPG